MAQNEIVGDEEIIFDEFKKEILQDYRLASLSREASLLGRREVLTGKAKFGVFGDGKELAQIAMAKQFQEGDFRSGYYRDQTFMLAIEQHTVEQLFSGLYANMDVEHEPTSGGRQMVAHYSTRNINPNGSWKDLTQQKNTSADISCTAGQIPRLLGLAQASKVYRELEDNIPSSKMFSKGGNEVAFGTIGDGSTSEGVFWEGVNAAGVMQIPMALSIWDDGYAISVPKKFQTTKESISEALKGLQREEGTNGIEIFKAKGWDYPGLCETYKKAINLCRKEHVPVLIHIEEVTQPQGHSTSGSHERYKSDERMKWMEEYDCNTQFKKWIIENGIADEAELEAIENETKKEVRESKKKAWKAYREPIDNERNEVLNLFEAIITSSNETSEIETIAKELKTVKDPIRKEIVIAIKEVLRKLRFNPSPEKETLINWLKEYDTANFERYSTHVYSETEEAGLKVEEVLPEYGENGEEDDGRVILKDNFDKILETRPEVLIFGEDVGFLGDVNQGLEGMQEKYGETRVADTGIREATIIGQATGMAMRGLRPIAEIQYLDYIFYALYTITDDIATLRYRTKGGQKAPVIIRTRGHRLEGIWHSGSPMGAIIHCTRGIHVCVPRNLTQTAGMYNTLLASDDPAIMVEPLNAYRTKEKIPTNLGEFKVPLGIPEIVKEGSDITIVSYGSTFNICIEASNKLEEDSISCELIDIRTLLPFDVNHIIAESLKKTNRLLIVDEDVPGGASGFILDEILTKQNGYYHLDSQPITLSAKEHRPAYSSDGDYFSKPSLEDIYEAAYQIMNEADPQNYPKLY